MGVRRSHQPHAARVLATEADVGHGTGAQLKRTGMTEDQQHTYKSLRRLAAEYMLMHKSHFAEFLSLEKDTFEACAPAPHPRCPVRHVWCSSSGSERRHVVLVLELARDIL